jgi:hypothetical protein
MATSGWFTILVDGLLSIFKPSRIRQRTNLRTDLAPSDRFPQTSRHYAASERHQSDRWARTAARHGGIHRIAYTTAGRGRRLVTVVFIELLALQPPSPLLLNQLTFSLSGRRSQSPSQRVVALPAVRLGIPSFPSVRT